ncbi:uncharacterized protein LOC142163945 [Nicotiana tabacum]|uniref:Uncharacterized protein LOC142163945 n=1 Tax=Nicotiana tabacum TaxID=4097 RepID=A0AC58RWT5_TOBAC
MSVLDNAFGCVLGQQDETRKKEQAIYYLCKKFTLYEARYTLLEGTCCALTWISQKLKHYLLAYTTHLIFRLDLLKYIFQKPMPIGKLAKWQILLGEFYIVYVMQKAIKGQELDDHLPKNPVDKDYKPLTTYFLDEEVLFVGDVISESYPGWKMFFNGAANFKEELYKNFTKIEFKHVPGVQNEFADALATLSSMIQHPDKNYIDPIEIEVRDQHAYCFHIDEEPDDNLHIDLMKEICKKFRIVHRNSTSYMPQMNGAIEAANKNIKRILRKIVDNHKQWHEKMSFALLELYKNFTKIEFKHVPGVQNEFADALATLSSMIQHPDKNYIDPIEIEVRDQHAYYFHIDEEPDGKLWYHDIKRFLEVEASTYKVVTKKVVVDFVCNNIVCRFGISDSIITDNADNLHIDLMKEICKKFRIVHRNSTSYRPQMNGAIEAANKNIKRILRKIVDNHKQWHEKMSFALLVTLPL